LLDDDVQNFKLYESYIVKWNSITVERGESYNVSVREQYIDMFKELLYTYTSPEQARIIRTVDFDDPESLSVAIPFFVKRLKTICREIKRDRDETIKNVRILKNRGSFENTEQFVKDRILTFLEKGDTDTAVLTGVQLNTSVAIEEAYDVYNDYYDIPYNKLEDFYSGLVKRDNKLSANTNLLSAEMFINEAQYFTDLINGRGIQLTDGDVVITIDDGSPLSVSEVTADFDTDKLQNIDYINFNQTNDDELKIIYEKQLLRNYFGTDYFYLSTNSEMQFVSGVLFEAENPVSNILNINNASSLVIPTDKRKYEREVGLYFKPTNFSLLKMKGPFGAQLNTNLQPNTTYTYPDPNGFGNIANLSKNVPQSPYVFYLTNDVYKNKSSGYGKSLVKSSKDDHNFYSYDSIEQKRLTPNTLSGFEYKYEEIVNKGYINKVTSDIFGNQFLLFVNDTTGIKQFDDITSFVTDRDIFQSANTTTQNKRSPGSEPNETSYRDLPGIPKQSYVVNISTNELQPLSGAFIDVFSKYNNNTQLYDELNNEIRDITCIDTTFIINTTNYTLIDSFVYDGVFNPSISQELLFERFDEESDALLTSYTESIHVDNSIYIGAITVVPQFSSTNTVYYFEVYQYDTITKRSKTVISRDTQPIDYFIDNFNIDIEARPQRIKTSKFAYNSLFDVFSIVTQFVDLNDNSYIHSLLFKIVNNEFVIESNDIIVPENYYDTTTTYIVSAFTDSYTTVSLSGDVVYLSGNGSFGL
jgi:hypothetical protein